ncbi:ATP-grasp fold amidoligase family protein [Marinicellulosiphila megalodicopiae]|uniref:ATP-grasp fold amidoligase family protein n=1 Tax=Marinicellulosiphila megalodicopiae TaxID=2724896 RepID=UPI003BB21145
MKSLLRKYEEQLVAKLDRLLGFPREKKRFLKAHDYPLNLNNPKSFNEKICHKKIYDRNPLLPIIADKYKVRGYIKEVLGKQLADEILIPLLAVADTPNGINFKSLPNEYVIKSNHGSSNNIIIKDGDTLNVDEFKIIAKKWLTQLYGTRSHEWAYDQIPRKIIVEQLLKDESGNVPPDYKFSMINGQCAFIQVDNERFENFNRTLFTPNWELLDVSWKRKRGSSVAKPQNLEKMLKLATILSKPFDYIRVDFYSLGDKIFFGELTNYPARGRGKFTPTEFDFEMGKKWTLPTKN